MHTPASAPASQAARARQGKAKYFGSSGRPAESAAEFWLCCILCILFQKWPIRSQLLSEFLRPQVNESKLRQQITMKKKWPGRRWELRGKVSFNFVVTWPFLFRTNTPTCHKARENRAFPRCNGGCKKRTSWLNWRGTVTEISLYFCHNCSNVWQDTFSLTSNCS